MKKHMMVGTLMLLAGSLVAANAGTKDDVTAAAKKLADKDNYSWKQTTEYAGGGRGFGGGASEGKVEKGGCLWVSMTMRTNTVEAVKKGEKGAIKTQDGWQSFDEASGEQGPGSFMARRMQSFKAPTAQIEDLVKAAKDLTKEGDVYSGEFTEEGAKAQMMFGGRGGGSGPEISGAKGSVKFWVKDGVLAKYETKVQGKMSFNGNERDIDRTTTVEIKDVGTTKLQVPAEASAKMK